MSAYYQLDLLSSSVAPYLACSDNFGNVVRLPKEIAFKKPYIAPNNSSFINCLLFDIDRHDAGAAWIDNDLAIPNWICQNPENGHAHYGYLLEKPVSRTFKAREAPQRYLARIQQAMTVKLGADTGYSHFLTKTPNHSAHRTIWGRFKPYSLDELRNALDDDLPLKLELKTAVGEGRNVTLFDSLRGWAYRERLKHKNFDSWLTACLKQAQMLNAFSCPLPYSEIKSTAKSVAKWTWQNFNHKSFADIQRKRVQKRWQKSNLLEEILEYDREC